MTSKSESGSEPSSDSLTDREREEYAQMPGLSDGSFRPTGSDGQPNGNPAERAADLAERFHKSEQDLPVKEMAEKSYGHRDF